MSEAAGANLRGDMDSEGCDDLGRSIVETHRIDRVVRVTFFWNERSSADGDGKRLVPGRR